MIKDILLKFGSQDKTEILKFNPGSITVFVGPNNSGKSLLLREIETFCNRGLVNNLNILKDVLFHPLDDEELNQSVKSMAVPFELTEGLPPGAIKYGRFHSTKGFLQFQLSNLQELSTYKNSPQHWSYFIQQYISMYVSRFGGSERFALIKQQKVHDLKTSPTNSLSCLFQDDEKRERVRSLIYEAFGKYFVIDPTHMGYLSIRLSDTSPDSKDVERGWAEQSVRFHKKAKPISNFSDGVQAFTGLIMTVIAGEEKIILIDEPEAFLHPTLAKLLGKRLSFLMSDRDGHLVVATHSPFFVMGCLQSGKKLNIIRLTYDESHSTAKLLESSKIVDLFKDPLLRSTGVIEALFHSAVVVTEGDTDRAFYHEINERLLEQDKPEGINNSLFLNAQNKQTIWRLILPLREMGIPTVGIVDIDFIKKGGDFNKILEACRVPHEMRQTLNMTRTGILGAFKKIDPTSDMSEMKNKGVSLLSGGERKQAEKFLKDLEEYGIFVVSVGEVESWLRDLHFTGHGSKWLIQVFDRMGNDPATSNYLKPAQGDVWDFLRSINNWIKNPNREGMKDLK